MRGSFLTMARMQTRQNREPNRSRDFVYSDSKTGAFEGGAVEPSGGRGRGGAKGTASARGRGARGDSQGMNVATANNARGNRDNVSMGVLSGEGTGGKKKSRRDTSVRITIRSQGFGKMQ